MNWQLIFSGDSIMSAFSRTSLPAYNVAPEPQDSAGPKKTITAMSGNSHLCLNSGDRTSGTAEIPVQQPINNFQINKGYPVLQGAFNSIRVSEIRFPWFIPNITPRNNSFTLEVNPNGDRYVVTVEPGFYTGATLATALNAAFATATPAVPANETPTVVYNQTGTFTITSFAGTTIKLYPYPVLSSTNASPNDPSLLTTMGFTQDIQNWHPAGAGFNDATGGIASMLYTQYVDICSDVLTQYQDAADVSTADRNLQHIICRLYVADEISIPQEDGTGLPVVPGEKPFVIHRQFKNSKIMTWNGQNSVDRIDIQLFDDSGNLLYTPPGMPNFQITLHAVEAGN